MTSDLLVTGQPGLQSEKTSLHEKHDGKPQHEKSKKKSKDSLSFAQDGFVLPQVRGAEGTYTTLAQDAALKVRRAGRRRPCVLVVIMQFVGSLKMPLR